MTPVGETLNGAPNLADISTAQKLDDHNTLLNARMSIRERIAELERWYQNYKKYLQDRVDDEDHHGAWDASVNMSETRREVDGLRFALEKLGG